MNKKKISIVIISILAFIIIICVALFLYSRKVTVHTPLFREVFWHEYAKIPRHTSQNSIAAGNLE